MLMGVFMIIFCYVSKFHGKLHVWPTLSHLYIMKIINCLLVFIFNFQGYPMNLEKLRAKLASMTRPAPEHLAVRDDFDSSDKINKFSMNIQD